MNELQKYMLMLQGGYKPQAGAITSDQMQGFKNAGLLNKTVELENQIQNINKPFGMIGDSVQPNKPIITPPPAPESIPQPNPQAELLKKQQRGNMLIALGDLLQGKDATAGFTQRQAGFDAQKERAERQAKVEQKTKEQELFIKQNPELAGAIRMNQLFGMDMPKPAKRDSYVAKDGYRYYVDGNQERVYPNVTVTEEQTQADIYKEEVANIKRIVMNEGIESPKLTQQQKDFYNNDLNNQGVLSLDQALASMMMGDAGNQNQENNKTYRITNKSYSGLSVDELVKQSQDLNPGLTREQVIKDLISNGIIAE
jgi:hypothetical protein